MKTNGIILTILFFLLLLGNAHATLYYVDPGWTPSDFSFNIPELSIDATNRDIVATSITIADTGLLYDGIQMYVYGTGAGPGNLLPVIEAGYIGNTGFEPSDYLVEYHSVVHTYYQTTFQYENPLLGQGDRTVTMYMVYEKDSVQEDYGLNIRLLREDETFTGYSGVSLTAAPVPVPATVLLFISGILGLAGFRKKIKA